MTPDQILDGLRHLCGYVENGTDCTVKIYQDDATKTWHVVVGKSTNWFDGDSMSQALRKAIEATPNDS